MALPVILVPLFTSIGRGLVEGFIGSETAKSVTRFAFDAIDSAGAVELRLRALHDELEAKMQAAATAGETWEPSQEELDAVWARIEARRAEWEALGS